jgi:hypothetical protein
VINDKRKMNKNIFLKPFILGYIDPRVLRGKLLVHNEKLTCITGKDDLFHKIENTVQYICVFCL